MNREFFDKMKEAKKLEQEAFMSILPEKVRGHVEVMEKEMKALFFECITSCAMNTKGQNNDSETPKNKVHKVNIS